LLHVRNGTAHESLEQNTSAEHASGRMNHRLERQGATPGAQPDRWSGRIDPRYCGRGSRAAAHAVL